MATFTLFSKTKKKTSLPFHKSSLPPFFFKPKQPESHTLKPLPPSPRKKPIPVLLFLVAFYSQVEEPSVMSRAWSSKGQHGSGAAAGMEQKSGWRVCRLGVLGTKLGKEKNCA